LRSQTPPVRLSASRYHPLNDELGAADEVLFHGVTFDPARRTWRTFERDALEAEVRRPGDFSWIDIQAPDISALNEVLIRYGIDLVLVSHFDRPEVLPRIVERSDCLAFYLYEIEEPEAHLDTALELREIRFHRMILVLGRDFVVTFHKRPLDAVDEVKASCGESFRLWGRTPGFVAFLFLQRCLYDYANLNLANDNFLDGLEEQMLSGRRGVLGEPVSVAGGNILTLKRLVASAHVVLMLLATKHSPFVSVEARGSFREMLQNAIAIRAAVDSSRDLLDGVLASIQARAANRTSEIARVLTVLSGVLLPLTLITGIYGMNFRHMPELENPRAYYYALALMAALAVGLFLGFRRLGWIGTGRSRSED
jgi:magnesium transporter